MWPWNLWNKHMSFENKLTKILTEYSLAGNDDDFRQQNTDRASRKAYNMQPSTEFGGRLKGVHTEPTVPPATDSTSIPIRLSYAVYNVFQRYWEGSGDPLYAVLSRRGSSVDWVTVFASQEEVDRLYEVSDYIISRSDDKGEVGTAKQLKEQLSQS